MVDWLLLYVVSYSCALARLLWSLDVHVYLTKVCTGWPLLMVDRFQLMLDPSGLFAKPIANALLAKPMVFFGSFSEVG
ncbi:hypothetical protein Nepgr_021408 [Nepenthes gracilis]|uniref:Uncharacterized protein n=1 Tax=Nepenthes gracilis TaxID=150966 RepID=A0AAD3SYS1_NEPGR|nr:hypothetical protein Nepgr_021408 [Nepenthes gracilis]